LRDVAVFTGSLVGKSRLTIAPRVGGRLEKLLVDVGDPVRRGDLVAQVDDEEFAQQVERAKAELAVARASVQECAANLNAVRREFDRIQTLREKQIASESEHDQVQAQLEVQQARCQVAEAQVVQKAAALKEAEIRLSYTRIHAVWEGGDETRFVGERFADQAALLTANTPVLSLLDISTLTAVVYAIERDYARIQAGQSVTVTTDAYPGRTFEGRVTRIAPQLQETSRQARVEVDIENPGLALKPGMFVRAAIEFEARADVWTVPVSALARRNGQQGVFVVDADGRNVHYVALELGVSEGDLIEVIRPVPDGPVVVMGQHLLDDGMTVRVVAPESPAAAGAGGDPAGAAAAGGAPGGMR